MKRTMKHRMPRLAGWLSEMAGVVLGFGIALISSRMFFRDKYLELEISGPVILDQEWIEIIPDRPLAIERDTQELTFYPDPPIQMDVQNGDLVQKDGRSATIQAEVVGSDGVIYKSVEGFSLQLTGELEVVRHKLKFHDFPRGITITKVRIISSANYPVKKILWRCYNWAEVHH